MPGSKQGGLKAAQTIKERHGADYYERLGAQGGKAKVPKGFAMFSKEKLRAISRRAGRESARLRQK